MDRGSQIINGFMGRRIREGFRAEMESIDVLKVHGFKHIKYIDNGFDFLAFNKINEKCFIEVKTSYLCNNPSSRFKQRIRDFYFLAKKEHALPILLIKYLNIDKTNHNLWEFNFLHNNVYYKIPVPIIYPNVFPEIDMALIKCEKCYQEFRSQYLTLLTQMLNVIKFGCNHNLSRVLNENYK